MDPDPERKPVRASSFCYVCTGKPRPSLAGFTTVGSAENCVLCLRPVCDKHAAKAGRENTGTATALRICQADHVAYAKMNMGTPGVFSSLEARREALLNGPKAETPMRMVRCIKNSDIFDPEHSRLSAQRIRYLSDTRKS